MERTDDDWAVVGNSRDGERPPREETPRRRDFAAWEREFIMIGWLCPIGWYDDGGMASLARM